MQIIIPFWSDMLPIKKLSLQEALLFQSWTTRSITTPSSLQSVQNSLQNGMWFSNSQSYLCIQTSLQSPRKIRYPTSAIFYVPVRNLLAHKINFTISTNTPFLYTKSIFHFPIFTYSHPYNRHQKYFPYLSHLAKSGSLIATVSKGVLWELTLFQPTLF